MGANPPKARQGRGQPHTKQRGLRQCVAFIRLWHMERPLKRCAKVVVLALKPVQPLRLMPALDQQRLDGLGPLAQIAHVPAQGWQCLAGLAQLDPGLEVALEHLGTDALAVGLRRDRGEGAQHGPRVLEALADAVGRVVGELGVVAGDALERRLDRVERGRARHIAVREVGDLAPHVVRPTGRAHAPVPVAT